MLDVIVFCFGVALLAQGSRQLSRTQDALDRTEKLQDELAHAIKQLG